MPRAVEGHGALPDAPAVEMLWEVCDPGGSLEARFGFQDGGSAGLWVAAMVAEHWGVRVSSCERIVISGHNALAWLSTPYGRLLAKWSTVRELFPHLSQVAGLTSWLDGRGLPVSAPVPSLDGRPQVEVDGVSMGLQHVIDGDLLDVGDLDQVSAAGAVLARLHGALAAYPDAVHGGASSSQPASLSDRINTWLESGGEPSSEEARDSLRRLADGTSPDRLPTQIVHGDFRSANVLCVGPQITAVIDFEDIRVDHCIVEVARSAVMLGTRFRNWGPVSPEVRATFLSGYQSVRRLTPIEASWWDVVVLWQALALVPRGDDPTGWGPSAFDLVAALNIGPGAGP